MGTGPVLWRGTEAMTENWVGELPIGPQREEGRSMVGTWGKGWVGAWVRKWPGVKALPPLPRPT
jgi:hypothetical protein